MTEEIKEPEITFPNRKRGWPKGKPRGPRPGQKIPRAPLREEKPRPMIAREDYALLDDDDDDRLKIPRHKYPENTDLQWITDNVLGFSMAQRFARFQRRGWEPVKTGDFDGRFDYFMPKGYKGEINVEGLILCARPLELTLIARAKERRRATEQVQAKEQQIRGGNVPNVSLDTQHETALRTNKVRKSYEPVQMSNNLVPEDE